LTVLTSRPPRQRSLRAARPKAGAKGQTHIGCADWGVSVATLAGDANLIIHCGFCGVMPAAVTIARLSARGRQRFDIPGNSTRHPTWKHATGPNCREPGKTRPHTPIPSANSSVFHPFC
jgi:hypothetical protein